MGSCCSRPGKITQPLKVTERFPVAEVESPLSAMFVFVRKDNIQKHYTLKKIIGSGYFGNVRLAVRFDGVSKEKFAVKSIAKEKVKQKNLLKRELETIHQVDHPNIIKVFEVYEDDRFIHLVMELCTGGELYERLATQLKFSEEATAGLIHKVLLAVTYMHSLKISHRDIKAENVMFNSDSPDSEIKLIDFGLAQKFGEAELMHSMVGTPYYVAPEVLQKNYGPECDVWSIGVLMYFMLSGSPPFDGENRKEIYIKILSAEVTFEDVVWSGISSEAKDLIQKLLSRTDRITACEAIDHPWFALKLKQVNASKHNKILRRLTRAKKNSALRTDVLNVVSRHLNSEELQQLNHIFRSVDGAHTGRISVEDFERALSKLGDAKPRDTKELFSYISGSDTIDYSTFLTAAMDRRVLYDREIRWMTFKFFDTEDDGYITLESMKKALEKLGIDATEEDVLAMIQEAGLKYQNWIDFQEFCKILEPLPDELSSISGSASIADGEFPTGHKLSL